MSAEHNPPVSHAERGQSVLGLGIPMGSEARRAHELFDEETLETFGHEFQHIGLTVGLFGDDEVELGLHRVIFTTAQATDSYKGLAVISNDIGGVEPRERALVAAAGMVDSPIAAAQGFESDAAYAAEHGDIEELKAEAEKILEKSALTPEIRVKMAEMAVYMQEVHKAPIITSYMLQAMYKQALSEIVSEENGKDPNAIRLFDSRKLADYLKEANRLADIYLENGSDGLDAWEIVIQDIQAKGYEVCSNCNAKKGIGFACECSYK